VLLCESIPSATVPQFGQTLLPSFDSLEALKIIIILNRPTRQKACFERLMVLYVASYVDFVNDVLTPFDLPLARKIAKPSSQNTVDYGPRNDKLKVDWSHSTQSIRKDERFLNPTRTKLSWHPCLDIDDCMVCSGIQRPDSGQQCFEICSKCDEVCPELLVSWPRLGLRKTPTFLEEQTFKPHPARQHMSYHHVRPITSLPSSNPASFPKPENTRDLRPTFSLAYRNLLRS